MKNLTINTIKANGLSICQDDRGITTPSLDLSSLSPEEAKDMITKLGEAGFIADHEECIKVLFDEADKNKKRYGAF
jgi:hypothetical protein